MGVYSVWKEVIPMADHSRRNSLLTGFLTFSLLTILLMVFVHHMDRNVFEVLGETKFSYLLVLFCMGLLYNFGSCLVYREVFRDKLPSFTLSQALDLTYLGVFGNIAAFVTGAIPFQSYYLYKQGLMAGRGMGLLSMQYIFYKVSVLIYAAVLLFCNLNWVLSLSPWLTVFLLISFVICSVIISVLILVCTSRRISHLAFWLLDKLPDAGKWPHRKQTWHSNIEALYTEAHDLYRNKAKFFRIMLLNFVKLFLLYCIPYLSMRMLGADMYSLMQVQILSSLMLLISNAIPNIAGMGGAEFAFTLVFSDALGDLTMAALILYRLSTYYFPFIVSIFVVSIIQKKIRVLNAHEPLPENKGK